MSKVVIDTDVISFLFKSHPIAYQVGRVRMQRHFGEIVTEAGYTGKIGLE